MEDQSPSPTEPARVPPRAISVTPEAAFDMLSALYAAEGSLSWLCRGRRGSAVDREALNAIRAAIAHAESVPA